MEILKWFSHVLASAGYAGGVAYQHDYVRNGGHILIEQVEISAGSVTHMPSFHCCRHCGKQNDVEKVFVALTVVETPDLFAALSEKDRQLIASTENALRIASRLDTSNSQAPLLICDQCGKQTSIPVRHEVRYMLVPAFLWCRCGQEVDLRYPGDSKRVRFTARFPYVPFLYCRTCKQKMLVPICGKDAWRSFVFRALHLLKRIIC